MNCLYFIIINAKLLVLEKLCVDFALLAFNLSPEMFVNLSNILIKFSKDLFDPSNTEDASPAKRDVLFYFPSMYLPFYILALYDLV